MLFYPREVVIKLNADPTAIREMVDKELQMTEKMQEHFVTAFTDVTLRLAIDADGSFAIRYWQFYLTN